MFKGFTFIALAAGLSGCGFALPTMDYQHQGDRFPQFVESIVGHVRCELSQAVQTQYSASDPKRSFLKNWGAQIALTLKAEEKGSFDPNLSYANKPGIFSISAGGHIGGDATREMTLTYFLPFQELLKDPHDTKQDGSFADCPSQKEPITGNLQINQTLQAGMRVWDSAFVTSETIADGGTWDSITHHVTFEVEATGSANPAWAIKRVKLNPDGTFLSATRARTDELLITMGPAVLKDKKIVPSQTASEAFSTERIRSVTNR